MFKFLIVVLVIAGAYWFIKSYSRKDSRPRSDASVHGEDMVRCAQCGVHLPRSESLMTGQLFYCSPDHRRLHERAG